LIYVAESLHDSEGPSRVLDGKKCIAPSTHDIVGWPGGPTHGRENARPFYEAPFTDMSDGKVTGTKRLYGDNFLLEVAPLDRVESKRNRPGNPAKDGAGKLKKATASANTEAIGRQELRAQSAQADSARYTNSRPAHSLHRAPVQSP
jgi:hypothetical protein